MGPGLAVIAWGGSARPGGLPGCLSIVRALERAYKESYPHERGCSSLQPERSNLAIPSIWRSQAEVDGTRPAQASRSHHVYYLLALGRLDAQGNNLDV